MEESRYKIYQAQLSHVLTYETYIMINKKNFEQLNIKH